MVAGWRFTLLENLIRYEHSVQRDREPSVNRHHNDDLQDLLPGTVHIQCAVDICFQLGLSVAHRSKRPDSHQLPAL